MYNFKIADSRHPHYITDMGLINENGAEFFCRHCHVNVVIDIRESKLEKLHAIVSHNARMVEANLQIAQLIAAL